MSETADKFAQAYNDKKPFTSETLNTPPAAIPAANPPAALPPGGNPPPAAEGATNPPAAIPPAGTPPAAGNPPPATEPEVDFSKHFDGKYKTAAEIKADLARIDLLTKELNEAQKNPKFTSDRHKLLYETGLKASEGMELSAVADMYNVLQLDLKNLPDQQVRFEAFRRDPQWKGLSQDEMFALFSDIDFKAHGDPSQEGGQTPVQKIVAKTATAAARGTLEKVQQDYSQARTAQVNPEEIAAQKAEYQTIVKTALTAFDGTKLSVEVDENGEKVTGAINFKLTPEQHASVVDAVTDPEAWFANKLFNLGILDKNNPNSLPNAAKFADLLSKIEYFEQHVAQAYTQGRNDKLAAELSKNRNPNVEKSGSFVPNEGTKTTQEKTVEAYMRAKGMIN